MYSEFGYIVRVVTKQGQDCWLGQRVYMKYDSALVVKHNQMDRTSDRYTRVYVVPATCEQYEEALSVQD